MAVRQSNDPTRRIAPKGALSADSLTALADRLQYVGASTHKKYPNDYGLVPPFNPRPDKSVCDDLRPVPLAEARALFRDAVLKGMVSPPLPDTGVPKYVWAVDSSGEVYEAKTKPEREVVYHGYRLGDDDRQRMFIKREWSAR